MLSKLQVPLLAFSLICGGSIVAAQDSSQINSADQDSIRKPCVWVHGAVRSPARLELMRPVRLSEAIELAGGTKETASTNVKVTHLRKFHCGPDRRIMSVPEYIDRDSTDRSIVPVDRYQLLSLAGDDDKANPYLRMGDIVNVEELPVIYVAGNVLRPQTMVHTGGMTLSGVIAKAELLRDAKTREIQIYRQPPNSTEQQVIVVNFEKIRKHRSMDLQLEPYDVVYAPPKHRRKDEVFSCYFGPMVPEVRVVK